MKSLPLLLSLFAVSCSCPSGFRDVPVPQGRGLAQAEGLDSCQALHYGTTLLGQADSEATVKALLEKGALPQGSLILSGKQYRGTSLWQASSPAVVNALIAAGADLNMASGPAQETPLCAALRKGDEYKVRALLAAGADANRADAAGESPLCLAAGNLNEGLCRLLLDHGARPDVGRTADGTTPLLMALKAGGYPEASSSIKCAVARLLLSKGASPVQADEAGTTPLHHAPAALVSELLAAGASVSARDHAGRTPLFSGGSVQRTEQLLRAGADINARDYQGNTAFDVVADAQIKSYLLVKGGRSGHSL